MTGTLLLVGLAFFAGFVFVLTKCVPLVRPALLGKLFDTVGGYQPAVIRRLHAEYAEPDAKGRRATYLEEVRWDNAFAVAYTGALVSWWAAAGSLWGGDHAFSSVNPYTIGMILALMGGASDLIENRLIAVILHTPAHVELAQELVYGVSEATNLKWLAGGLSFFGLLFVAVGGHNLITGAV